MPQTQQRFFKDALATDLSVCLEILKCLKLLPFSISFLLFQFDYEKKRFSKSIKVEQTQIIIEQNV